MCGGDFDAVFGTMLAHSSRAAPGRFSTRAAVGPRIARSAATSSSGHKGVLRTAFAFQARLPARWLRNDRTVALVLLILGFAASQLQNLCQEHPQPSK